MNHNQSLIIDWVGFCSLAKWQDNIVAMLGYQYKWKLGPHLNLGDGLGWEREKKRSPNSRMLYDDNRPNSLIRNCNNSANDDEIASGQNQIRLRRAGSERQGPALSVYATSCCAQLRIIIIKYNHNRLIDKELLKQCFGIGSQWLVLIISNVDPSLSVLAQFKSV